MSRATLLARAKRKTTCLWACGRWRQGAAAEGVQKAVEEVDAEDKKDEQVTVADALDSDNVDTAAAQDGGTGVHSEDWLKDSPGDDNQAGTSMLWAVTTAAGPEPDSDDDSHPATAAFWTDTSAPGQGPDDEEEGKEEEDEDEDEEEFID